MTIRLLSSRPPWKARNTTLGSGVVVIPARCRAAASSAGSLSDSTVRNSLRQDAKIKEVLLPKRECGLACSYSGLTLRFSCGARSAFKLKEKGYLRNMLSRRQLQALC